MEEIEYLEEYEDFILPSGNICTSRLSADRTSMDSLDGIYKDLISDPTLAIAEEPTMSQFTVKPNSSADIISPISKVSVGQLQNSLHSPKSSTSSAITTYLTTITTIEPPKTPAYKLSTFNRNNSSVLQRSDKLKSVATVKPTLQRIINPAKQTIRNKTPPLKNNAMGQSFQTSTLEYAAAQTAVASVPKSSTQQSKTVNAIVNAFHGSGVDPLSLDDDGLLNFDVDKHGLVDDFDFDSDLDNSIIGGISELDSVDFSDEFSEGNFDLDSDLSDSSDGKKRVKKKRPQDTSTKNQKNKPGTTTAKQEQAIDQASTSQNKRPQQVKVGAKKLSLSQIITTDKRTDLAVVTNKKDIPINSLMPKSDQPVSNDKMPKLQPQQLSSPKEILSHIVPSSNVTNLAAATKDTDDTGSHTPKDGLHFLDPDYVPYVKRDSDKTYVNKKRLSNNEETAKTNGSTSEPGSLKSPPSQHNTEHANSRGAATPDKNVRIKFGSMCLKSIKPPVCKDLIVNMIPDIDVMPTASVVNRIPQLQTDAPIASEHSATAITPAVKRTPVDAPTKVLFEKSTSQEDAIIVLPRSDLVLKKITVKDASTVPPPRPDFVLKETPNSDVLIFPDLPHLIITKIPQKDTSSVPQKSDLIVTKIPQKDAAPLTVQIPNLSCASPTSKELLHITEMSVLRDTIPELNAFPPCAETKIVFAAASKSNTPYKDCSPQKSTMQQATDNKAAHCKTKELESSGKSTRQSLKGVPAESGDNKQLSSGAPNQSDVVKDSERVVFSTVASPQTRFGRFTKVNNRWKDSAKKIEQKETKIDNKKTSLLSNKFKACSLKIRLNKNVVAQFLRSSKVAVKSKASTNLMPQKRDRGGKSKPLKHVTHKAPDPDMANPSALTTNEPPARGMEKRSFTELDTTEKDSDKSSTIVKEQKETQIKEAATEALRPTSRKRKKTFKANGRAKTLRRSVKDLFETPDTTKSDVSKDRTAVIELSVPDKELAVKQTLSTDAVISSANPTVRPNVATTETEQMETRHHRPNACSTTNDSNVGGIEKTAVQLPSNGAISSAQPTVLPNVAGTEAEQMETGHLGPIVRTPIKDSEVCTPGKSDDQLPSTDGISPAEAIVRPETEQMETRHRRPNAGSAINESNTGDTEIPAEQSPANGAISSAEQLVRSNVSCMETEQMETCHREPNVRSTTNEETTERPVDKLPSTDAISSAKPTGPPTAATVGIGQEIRTRRLNARSTANIANMSNKEQLSLNDAKSPAQVATYGVEHKETRQRRPNVRTALNKTIVGDIEKSCSSDVIRPVRVSGRHKEGGIRVRQMEVRSRRRAAIDSPLTGLGSVASGRPMTRRTLKEKLTSGKSKKERQLKRISPRPAAVVPKVAISLCREPDTTLPEPTHPVLTNDVPINENAASASTSRTESVIDPELDLVRPKNEYTDDPVIGPGQQESASSCTFDVHPKNTLSNSGSDPQVTVFELPSFIVMKTKIITRRDLRSGRAYIPPLVKQKFNKLAEERNVRPVIKTERADFNDVCTEINALLDRNANYLSFATVAERQTRMNQVLADSSLSVEDAQCALKFLRSYLLPPSSKEGRPKSKNHLYVPIYDSQRKIIGYRKRISKVKRSIDSNGKPASQRMPNSSTRNSSAVDNNRTPNVPASCETEVFQRVIQFTTKKEPLVMDGNDGNDGNEIIVPDAAPSTEQCIKNEVDSILS